MAGLPLLGLPATLLALPTLAYLLLSDYELQVQISKHYSAPLLPFLFLSTVVALQRLQNWHPRAGQLGTLLLLLASLFGAYSFSPLPGGGRYQPEQLVVSPEDKKAQALLESLPSDAKVASEWGYFPWLANREVLDSILNPNFRPINRVIPDYIVTSPPTTAAITAPTYPWLAPELFELDDKPLRLPRYKVEQTLPDGTMLWQRRPDEEDIWLERVNAPFERGMILVGAAIPPETRAQDSVAEEVGAQKSNALGQIQILAGNSLPIWLAWGASEPQDKRITFTIQLWDSNNQRVAQIDQEMGSGSFPTTHWHDWLKQPVVVGEYSLFLPPELPPAQYRLMAGAYESESVTPLLQGDGNGWVELGTIAIKE